MQTYNSSTPRGDWSECQGCRLCSTRTNVAVRRAGIVQRGIITELEINTPVPSLPSVLSSIPFVLFIGEAPGESEDRHGKPFIGPTVAPLHNVFKWATQYHPCFWKLPPNSPCPSCTPTPQCTCPICYRNRILDGLRHKYRALSFYFMITNTVCCRPTNEIHTKTGPTLANRQPTTAEQELCKPHTLQLLDYYKFTHVVCLGEVSKVYYKKLNRSLPALELLHPAYILRLNYQLLTIKTQAKVLREWIEQ